MDSASSTPDDSRGPDVLAPNPHLTRWDQRWINLLVVCAVAFSVLPSGFNWSVADDVDAISSGSLNFQLQWGSLLLLSVYLTLRHSLRTLELLRHYNLFLLAMCLYALIGVVWSPVPMSTLKKALQFFGLILLTMAVQLDGRRWTHHCLLIAYTLVAIMVASAFVSLAFPSVGIDSYFGYAWRGVLANKNTLGGIAAITVVYLVGLWHASALPSSMRWWSVLLSVTCVVLSTSSTSFVVMCLGLGVFWVLQRQHIGSPLWLLRLLVVLGIVLLLAVHAFYVVNGKFPDRSDLLGPVASLFGKSSDLTGRADIWEPLMREIGKHWLFGIGYGAFWLGPGSASQPILDTLPWIPFQGHNNYLDVINELGAVGGVLWLLATMQLVRQLFHITAYDRSQAAMYGALLVTFYIGSMSETALFRTMGPQFIFYMLICASLSSSEQWRNIRRGQEVDLSESRYRADGLVPSPGSLPGSMGPAPRYSPSDGPVRASEYAVHQPSPAVLPKGWRASP